MDRKVWLGVTLILAGILALVHNLGLVDVTAFFILAVFMVVIGVIATWVYVRNDRSLPLLIIGLVTFLWGVAIGLFEADLIGFGLQRDLFVLGMALGILAVYFHNERHWWAVIPGGVLGVIAVVDAIEGQFYLSEGIAGFLIFFGIGLVFFYLYLIRDEKNRLSWARYPAFISILVSLFVLYTDSQNRFAQLFVAVALIGLGIGLVLGAKSRRPVPGAPGAGEAGAGAASLNTGEEQPGRADSGGEE